MRARLLQTVAAAAGPMSTATRPQCARAAAAPLRAAFLLPLPHRRFQSGDSNSPNGLPPSNRKPKQAEGSHESMKHLLSDLMTEPSTPAKSNPNSLMDSYSLSTTLSRERHTSSFPFDFSSQTNNTATDSLLFNDSLMPAIEEDTRIPRMGPTAGRSILVQGDVTMAFTRLKSVVQANRVRSDKMKQRFHERPGLKRKRLKRERHRRRFKEGFKRMVGIVLDMKNRGM